jgi:hypothetical protein
MLEDAPVQSSSRINQMMTQQPCHPVTILALSATGFDHHAAIHEGAMDHAEVAQSFI